MKDRLSEPPTPQEARLRTILNSMVEAVFVTDDKGRVVLTNRALDALIDRDVRGRRAKNVIRSPQLKNAIRKARKKNEATEVELETLIGERFHTFHAQVAPLPKGQGVVTVLHDVTSLKNADRVRRDFVANASHELRTPLTAIRGFAETLQDGALESPDAARRFVSAILRHTLRLQRLAEDLTVLAQAESPEHDYQAAKVDVRSVFRDSAASLETFARRKGVRLSLEMPNEPVNANVSARALDHVLINLIENAIKYSNESGEVVARLVPTPESLVFEVQDWGPGIPAKYHDRIFERFYRVDKGRSREEGGTGLGLAIVRHLVGRMGGSVEVQSEVGQGALFRVTIPPDTDEPDDEPPADA
ncbi:MAG: sensor histidine kinase [Sandaracinaceae bacterium]